MKKVFFILILQIFIFTPAKATQLDMELSKQIRGIKTYIIGKTNLPEGTKMGVEVTGSGNYRAQDFKVFVKQDGTFSSAGFSNRGGMLLGRCRAKIFTYNNKAWQTESVIKKLSTYKGNGLENGKMEVIFNFVNKKEGVKPSTELEKAFDREIQGAKTKREKCSAIIAVMGEYIAKGYSAGKIEKGYDYIDLKYPGLIDSCDN